MRCLDDRCPTGEFGFDRPLDELLRERIRSRRRLVEQQKVRALGESLRDEGALTLPAGEGEQRAPGEVGDPERLETLVDNRAISSP